MEYKITALSNEWVIIPRIMAKDNAKASIPFRIISNLFLLYKNITVLVVENKKLIMRNGNRILA